jgi:hypothetical protein
VRRIGLRALLAVCGAVVTLGVVELAGRIFLLSRPSYEVIFLEPDRSVGWKIAPSFSFTWTGVGWYAADFSVRVNTNSLGFRDLERSEERQPGVIRIAVLGDSFVEALQVDRDQTAAALLESSLNATMSPDDPARARFEVLNFGVSNYGMGQFLLVWEAYVRRFAPDWVVVPVAEHLLRRTVRRFEAGAFPETRSRRLWVRPTFRLVGGRLLREPARDFDEFLRTQRTLASTSFGTSRARMRETSVLRHLAGELGLVAPRRVFVASPPDPASDRISSSELVELNLEILRTLGSSVRESGGRLVVADLHGFFPRRIAHLTEAVEALCAREGFVYVPAYEPLVAARLAGHRLRWPTDPHFDHEANRLFAGALHDALTNALLTRESYAGAPATDRHAGEPPPAGE